MTDHTPLGPGAEFDIVRALLARFGPVASGIGDDAGIVEVPRGETLLVSTDIAAENVHFRRGWLSPKEIGYRSATAALSDLAAMGATPRGMVVALTLPNAWRADAEALADGLARAARDCSAPVIGGDLSDGTLLSLAVTVFGSTARPLTRAGARAGDAVWVTGKLGGPARALAAFERGETPPADARVRFAKPRARIGEAIWLAAHGASAAIDISDGLVADLGHIAAASRVTMTIALESIPSFDGVSPTDAAASGEEYELAITGPQSIDAEAFSREFGIPLTRVGVVAAAGGANDPPVGVVVTSGGAIMPIAPGFDHFAR